MARMMMEPAISEALRPLSRQEYDRLVAMGLFENERVELVRGVVVEMAPIGADHCDVVEVLTELLVPALKGRARVRVQSSFAASDDSEPEPDVLVVDKAVPRGVHEHPASALLAIEVAESSQRFDRDVKARLYAEAGIPEYWIVDVVHRVVEVFREPSKGRYLEVSKHAAGVLNPRAFPDVAVPLADLFLRSE